MPKQRKAIPVTLTPAQRKELERLWFVFGNRGPKATYGNHHQFIQGFLEHGRDFRPLFTTRTPKRDRPTPECEQAVERVLAMKDSPEDEHHRDEPERHHGLRVVTALRPPRLAPDPELKALMEEMKRRQQERNSTGLRHDDPPDVA